MRGETCPPTSGPVAGRVDLLRVWLDGWLTADTVIGHEGKDIYCAECRRSLVDDRARGMAVIVPRIRGGGACAS